MHGGISHIFFNMFALVMFGGQLERIWGPKRFLTFYFVTALGAALIHTLVNAYQVHEITGSLTPIKDGLMTMQSTFSTADAEALSQIYLGPVVGASGAIYGLLLGFAMLFPNTELMLIFLPIPIKAKYFVPLLMIGELYLGANNFQWDNIAHFAHLGGALFGFIMIMIWKRDRSNFF
jgi:rhomboid-like protein